MGSSDRRSKTRKRKRLFHGNQHQNAVLLTRTNPSNDEEPQLANQNITTTQQAAETPPPTPAQVLPCQTPVPVASPILLSASAKKLHMSSQTNVEEPDETTECYVLMNSLVLKELVDLIGICPICASDVNITHEMKQKKGLCHFFSLHCISCDWENTLTTSKEIKRQPGARKKHFDVNVRSVIAFREIGRGHTQITNFCGTMNIPPPMNKFAYEKTLNNILHDSYMVIARESMKRGAREAMPEKMHVPSDNVEPVTVSFDGTWQRRGYASLNGAVTAICQGKCIDIEIMSKVCRSCMFWKPKSGTPEYNDWKANHDCVINHVGSAGSMEAVGARRIYDRSVTKNNLRYLKYRGDGDSKAYADVVEADPYKGLLIEKSECVGHVQKRVGARLRNLKDSMKGKKFERWKKVEWKRKDDQPRNEHIAKLLWFGNQAK